MSRFLIPVSSLFLCLGLVSTTALAQDLMWQQAPQWQCVQDGFEASCGGPLGQECTTRNVRSPEELLFDFAQGTVVRKSAASTSYVPITGRATDKLKKLSFILYGEAGNYLIQYAAGQGVITTVSPRGGSVAVQFYSCAPAVPEEG